MKTTFLLLAFFFLAAVSVQSQINPLTFKDTGSYRTYTTKLESTYKNLTFNQSQAFKDKIRKEVKIINLINERDCDKCFSTTKLNEMADTNVGITILLYYDQSGKIYAGRMVFNENNVVLTETEVTCIFSKLFFQKLQFQFLNTPFNFYYASDFRYKPKRAYTNPKEDPDFE